MLLPTNVQDRRRFFQVTNGKANLALPSDVAVWRQLVSVSLGNGAGGPDDLMGVATAWEWPSALDGLTAADLLKVQHFLQADGAKWRQNDQAADWVGHGIGAALNLDTSDKAIKTRVKAMVAIWLKSGALRLVMGHDSKRNPRQFIEVGELATRLT